MADFNGSSSSVPVSIPSVADALPATQNNDNSLVGNASGQILRIDEHGLPLGMETGEHTPMSVRSAAADRTQQETDVSQPIAQLDEHAEHIADHSGDGSSEEDGLVLKYIQDGEHCPMPNPVLSTGNDTTLRYNASTINNVSFKSTTSDLSTITDASSNPRTSPLTDSHSDINNGRVNAAVASPLSFADNSSLVGTKFSVTLSSNPVVVTPSVNPQIIAPNLPTVLVLQDIVLNTNKTFTEEGSALLLSDDLTLSDIDNTSLESATITLVNPLDGSAELLSVQVGSSGLTTQYTNGVLLISGSATVAAYQDVLRTVSYHHSSQGPHGGTRTVTWVINDGSNDSATGTTHFTVIPINDAPVLDNSGAMTLTAINEDNSNATGTTVANIINSAGGNRIADVDANAVEGIAVTDIDNSHGTWQYKLSGGSWTAFGGVSDSSSTLLASTASVRFVPDANYNGSGGNITFRAWDQSSGSNGATGVNVSSNGGITAYSSSTETATITINAVNDAPVLDNSGTMTLTTINEDNSSSAGDTVANIIASAGGDRISDIDVSALEGIAVTSVDTTHGSWQYKLSGGSWTTFGSVSNTSATLLASTASIRFVPTADYNGSAGNITFRAWDRTSGSDGATGVNVSSNGGITAYSSSTETATLSIIAVNDAPVLDDSALLQLDAIAEDDVDNAGTLIADMVAGAISEVDADAVQGIAVFGVDDTYGSWQYALDGSTWQDFPGDLAEDNAVLLVADARIRFVPDADYNGEESTLSFRAWDRTSGSNGDTGVDISDNGATTAFSALSNTANITVNAINDAPVLDDSTPLQLEDIDEDPSINLGTLVGDLLALTVSDADIESLWGLLDGIAIIGQDTSHGSWEYSIDLGDNWTALDAVSNSSATLLSVFDLIRFVPDTNYNGDSGNITFRAWDMSTGNSGDTGVVIGANHGGTTAYSDETNTAALTVHAINDAPVLDNSGAMTLTTINEDDSSSAGDTVANIIASAGGDRISDVDASAVEGIAVIGADTTNGSWEYKLSGGSWTAFDTVSNTNATLLASTASIRFVPDANYNGSAGNITFRAWDRTSGSDGDTGVNVSSNGGITAYSSSTETATLSITAVNDAPVLEDAVLQLDAIDEDDFDSTGTTVADIVAATISDVDASAEQGIAVFGVDNSDGTWQYTLDGSTWEDFAGDLAEDNATLLAADASIRFVPDADYNGDEISISFRAWDRTSGSNGATGVDISSNGDTTAFSVLSNTISINVNAINDAPVLDNSGAMTLTTINEDNSSSAGDTVAAIIASAGGDKITDIDASAVEGIAVTGADMTNGLWQYKLSGGSWTTFDSVSNTNATLLASSASIRFVPNADYNGSGGNITFRAWDSSSGSDGATGVDVSTNGNTTAYSTSTETATITITAVNDAPVLDNSGAMTLTTINEDNSSSVGDTVVAIIASAGGDKITDIDASAIEGIAVTGADMTNGLWQYKLSGGSWTTFGAVTNTSATLLASTASIRFVPNADYNGSAGNITFRAWDRTSGSDGDTVVNVSSNGGVTAYSSSTETATLSVTAINDAPVLDDNALLQLDAIDEDEFDNAGTTVADIVADAISDVDAGAEQGIAVFGVDNSNGTWQYALDGSTWEDFAGDLAEDNAMLLAADASIRFVPDADYNGEESTISFRAWDRISGSNGATGVDVTNNGGTTIFSALTNTASITVNSINDAPILDDSTPLQLEDIDEDPNPNSGTLVGDMLALTVSDVDAESLWGLLDGVAIIGQDTSHGSWEYSIDLGDNWTTLGAVSNNSATLLSVFDLIRFVPDTNYNGNSGNITFRAWDMSTGSSGDTGVMIGANHGGTTAYSDETNTAALTVHAMNDAPTFIGSDTNLYSTDVDEDDFNPPGILVSDIVGNAIDDVDASAVQGIAVVGVHVDYGFWQYSLDGSAWDTLDVSDANATLLALDAYVRFIPLPNFSNDSHYPDPIVMQFRAWDKTTGSNGDTGVDATSNGGITAFSAATRTLSVTVNPINDAPELSNFTPLQLDAIDEDPSTNTGTLVSDLLADTTFDMDDDSVGIAITGRTTSHGSWQYSLNDGSTWTALGAVSNTSATLLSATDLIRFIPNANYTGNSGNITFRAWDMSTGTAGSTGVNVSSNGGTTAYSNSNNTASVTVNAVNDAPVLDNSGSMTLTTINEDDSSSVGNTVAAVISSAGGDRITDVDSGAVEGIAVTDVDTTHGSWQYKLSGGSWTTFVSVSDTSATLLASTASIRFVPTADYNGNAGDLTFRAWDSSSGSDGATGVDVSVNGSSTAYSAITETATLTITAVNDAPVLDNSDAMTLTTINEDDSSSVGDTVAAIIASAGGDKIIDVDASALEGIAVTSVDTTHGNWQYKLSGGSWTTFGAVSNTSATLLASTASIRFVPTADYNGNAGNITFRAWDQTSGSDGATGVNVSTNGTTTAYSSSTETATITITAVNDAPVLDNAGTMTLTSINQDDTTSSGTTVADIISSAGGDRITDMDTSAEEGIAVTGVDTTHGLWQYKLSGGSWITFGAVSNTSATLLTSTANIRFVPDSGYNGNGGNITFRAWDQNSGSDGATGVNVSTNGTTTAYSTSTETATITIVATSSAPVLDNTGTMTLAAINEDDSSSIGTTVAAIISSAGGDRITDADGGAVEGIAVTAVDTTHGSWQYKISSGSWTTFGSLSDGSATLLASTASIRFVPDADYNGSAGDITFRAWDQTSGSDGATDVDVSSNGGSTAYSSSTETATITINAVNDAPVIGMTDFSTQTLFDTLGTSQLVTSSTLPGSFSAVNDSISAMTVEFWVNFSDLSSDFRRVAAFVDGANSFFQIVVQPEDNNVGFSVYTGSTMYGASAHGLQTGEWYHFAATWDGSGSAHLYVDGVDQYGQNYDLSAGDVSGYGKFAFGGRADNSQYSDAQFEDVRIWSTERTAAQIQSNMLSTLVGNESGLVGWWTFAEGSGTSVTDRAAAGNTMTGTLTDTSSRVSVYSTTATEDTSLAITGISVSDVDAASGDVTVTLSVTNGYLSVSTSIISGLSLGDISGNGTNTVTLTGTLSAINTTLAATDGLYYRGDAGFTGIDSLSILIDDGGNTGSGGNLTAMETLQIRVAAVNDAPSVTMDTSHLSYHANTLFALDSSDTDAHNAVHSVALSNGDVLMVWQEYNNSGGTDVYGRVYDDTGAALQSKFRINQDGDDSNSYRFVTSHSVNPLAVLSDGSVAVTWSSDVGGYWEVFARTYTFDNASVQTAGSLITVASDVDKDADGASVIALANGEFAVGFEQRDNGTWYGDSSSEVYLRKYDSDDTALGAAQLIAADVATGPYGISITALSDGTLVAVWNEYDDDVFNVIKAQRYTADGEKIGSEFTPSDELGSMVVTPQVVATADGGYVIVWQYLNSNFDAQIKASYYPVGQDTPIVIPISTNSTAQGYNLGDDETSPTVVALPGGGFAVTWMDDNLGQVYLQRFNQNGQTVGAAELVNDVSLGVFPADPNLSVDANGRLVVTWHANGNDVAYSRIYQPELHLGQSATLAIEGLRIDDDASGNVQVTLSVDDGSLSLGSTSGLSFSVGDGTSDSTMTFIGAVSRINDVLSTFNYTSSTLGSHTLTVTVNDQGGNGTGGSQSTTYTTTLHVDDITAENATLSVAKGDEIAISGVSVTGADETVQVWIAAQIGNLRLGTTTGVTVVDGNDDGSESYMIISGSRTNINNALAQLYYTAPSGATDYAQLGDSLQMRVLNRGTSNSNLRYNPDNGHFYELVEEAEGTMSWTSALAAAEARSLDGMAGYLATLTSAAETSYITDNIASNVYGDMWLSGHDVATNDWRWDSGPEEGVPFWTGGLFGNSVDGQYENWQGGEPNNSGGIEDYLQLRGGGEWNDASNGNAFSSGYIVEYGGMSGDTQAISLNLNILASTAEEGTSGNDTITSTTTGVVSSLAGNDTIDYSASAVNIVLGGDGNDTIHYDPADLLIDGGAGTDTLVFDGASPSTIDLTQIVRGTLQGIEKIQMDTSATSELQLDLAAVFDLSDTTNTLFINGDSDNSLLIKDLENWTLGSDTVINTVTYHTFTNQDFTLYLDQDMTLLQLTIT